MRRKEDAGQLGNGDVVMRKPQDAADSVDSDLKCDSDEELEGSSDEENDDGSEPELYENEKLDRLVMKSCGGGAGAHARI